MMSRLPSRDAILGCVPAAKQFIFAMQVSDRALAQADPKAALRAVMKSWLPLSEAVLGMAVEQLPDPISAAPERLPRLLALGALDAMAAPLPSSVQQVPSRLSHWLCVEHLQCVSIGCLHVH